MGVGCYGYEMGFWECEMGVECCGCKMGFGGIGDTNITSVVVLHSDW